MKLPAGRQMADTKLASYLTGVRILDLNSGFRAFRREVALQFLHLLPRAGSHA